MAKTVLCPNVAATQFILQITYLAPEMIAFLLSTYYATSPCNLIPIACVNVIELALY